MCSGCFKDRKIGVVGALFHQEEAVRVERESAASGDAVSGDFKITRRPTDIYQKKRKTKRFVLGVPQCFSNLIGKFFSSSKAILVGYRKFFSPFRRVYRLSLALHYDMRHETRNSRDVDAFQPLLCIVVRHE